MLFVILLSLGVWQNCLAFGEDSPTCASPPQRASFKDDVQPIFESHCTNCHTGYHDDSDYFDLEGAKANFETYQAEGTQGIGGRVENKSMPPSTEGLLDPCLIDTITVWGESNFPE